eukprot:g6156.t1
MPSAGLALLLVAGCATAFSPHFVYKERYACGVCHDVVRELLDLPSPLLAGPEPCARFGACHAFNSTALRRHLRAGGGERALLSTCVAAGFCAAPAADADADADAGGGGAIEVRVTPAHGTKEYGLVRVSVVSNGTLPAGVDAGAFDYSAPFKYKWTGNTLLSKMVALAPASGAGGNGSGSGFAAQVPLGTGPAAAAVAVSLPAQGAGVSGLLLGDPCVSKGSITSLVACQYAGKFQTLTRTPALINAIMAGGGTDFWALLGDNFYDKTGEVTAEMFARFSADTKASLMLTVPGNHDYWVLGAPAAGTKGDQYANGHMQWYAQDTKASAALQPGDAGAPFDFSSDPGKGHPLRGGNLPAIENSFHYHQVGNLGVVAYSGAYALEDTRPLMAEACAWLGARGPTLQVAMIVGHWDVDGLGCSADMAGPAFYDEMKVLPGCDALDSKGMLKFFMGHTHCNVPHPHGKTDTGFMVAGQGMEGCGNYGMPIVDTTGGRVRVWHFEIVSKEGTDSYDDTYACLQQKGWRGCTDHADLWLDQPINATAAAS